MKKPKGVLLSISGPVAVLAQDFWEWKSANISSTQWLSNPFVLIETGFFEDFIDSMLYEIFKEHYLSEYVDEDAPATVFLRNFGLPEALITKIKHEFTSSVVEIIYRTLPDLYFANVQPYDYGMTDRRTILLFVQEEVDSPVTIRATPPEYV